MKTERPRWITPDGIIALFTIVIAATAILQGFIFLAQLDEMRIDQRAWLSVKPLQIQFQMNQGLSAPVLLLNAGKTVAKNIHGWVFVQRRPKGSSIDFTNPTAENEPRKEDNYYPAYHRFNMGVLFPNDPTTLKEPTIGGSTQYGGPAQIEPTQNYESQYDRGEIYIDIRGRFTYADAAGNPHWTQICNIYAAPGHADSVPNSTSDDCMAWNKIDDNK